VFVMFSILDLDVRLETAKVVEPDRRQIEALATIAQFVQSLRGTVYQAHLDSLLNSETFNCTSRGWQKS
jgi:hypothetical protein